MKKQIDNRRIRIARVCLWFLFAGILPAAAQAGLEGWLDGRGPYQNGTSDEVGLPEKWVLGGENDLWTYPLSGQGSPIVVGDRLYGWGYGGEGNDIREFLFCLDTKTGKEIWKEAFSDFLSDNVYRRYSIGSPAVDPETGNIFLLTTPGIFACFSADGEKLYEVSMMEEFGRLTFPNGRIGGPAVDGEFVYVRGITSNWGSDGPARDRFYCFEKQTGKLVWTSTPGETPQDSSSSPMVFEWRNGKRVFYTGTGCGNVVCINARSGDPIWRFKLSHGGVDSGVVLTDHDTLIAIHGKENVDSSDVGRMVAIKLGTEPKPGEEVPAVLGKEHEVWRNPLVMFTSSPTIVKDRVYQITHTGELACVDAATGKVVWELKLGESQLHASPLYADGKLYIPMVDGNFYIIRPGADSGEILCETKLEGNCVGTPVVWEGRIFVHTTEKLYCFGNAEGGPRPAPVVDDFVPETGEAVRLQVVPSEVLMRPGETVEFEIHKIDKNGYRVGKAAEVTWEKFIPPTAKVKSEMDASFDSQSRLSTGPAAKISAGSFKATSAGLSGTIRGRVLPRLPIEESFEAFQPTVDDPLEEGAKYAFPPLPWIGARFKFDIREVDGSKVFAKTLDRILFQRAMAFIGHPSESNYTVQADVMTDGNRRTLSSGGVINQRYIIALVGNAQILEISSNYERLKVSAPFPMKPKVWYRLSTRVDVAEDGSGVIRAKAWPRDEPEPAGWTIEVPHKVAHTHGAPGLYGFAPQSKFKVYLDNVVVTPNE